LASSGVRSVRPLPSKVDAIEVDEVRVAALLAADAEEVEHAFCIDAE